MTTASHDRLPGTPAPVRAKALLAAAFFAAVLLRLLPINYGAPQPGYFSSDEIDAVSRAVKMGTGDLMPIHANKPTFYNAVIAGCYGTKYAASKLLLGMDRKDFEREFFVKPFGFYRIARAVSIAASVASLALMLFLLRAHPPVIRLFALLVLGLAPSSVYYGHVAKEDALAGLLAFVSFASAVEALGQGPAGGSTRETKRWISLSALSAGLAISTKYNCFFCVMFPAIASWMRTAPGRQRLRQAGLVAALTALAFAIGTPYAVLHPVSFVEKSLGSAVASQVTGAYNILSYAENRGPSFTLAIMWREFGLALPVAIAGLVCLAVKQGPLRWLLCAPPLIYLAALCLSSQLDYQYVIVISPVMIYGAASAWSQYGSLPESARAPTLRSLSLVAAALVVLACGTHLVRQVRQTAEFLGGDTRLVAREWLAAEAARGRLSGKPLLIASGQYYHYYPAMDFDAGTYRELYEYARSTGAEGDYFRRAQQYAADGTGVRFAARFLDIRTGFRRLPDGGREFETQAFPLDLGDYRGKYSLTILPANTLRLLDRTTAGLEGLQDFIRQLAELPVAKTFDPMPWQLAGPKILIVQGP